MASAPLRRVLVLVKTSDYERYRELGALDDPSTHSDPQAEELLERLLTTDRIHRETVEIVESVLRDSGLEVVVRTRATKRDAAAADLVVAVGGDGTFLRCAQHVDATPMLGVNSAPGRSVGHYCGANASNFQHLLDRILEGTARPTRLTRIAAAVGGRWLPHRALNETLFCHWSPAASSRYILRVGEREELQLSSGIWVATASGSSGAIRSAGGEAMRSSDDRLQYRVREPYSPDGRPMALEHGYTRARLELVAASPHFALFLDGHHRSRRIGFGERVLLEPADKPLAVYAYPGEEG